MDTVHQLSREEQEKAGYRQKAGYDLRCLGRTLSPGDQVWIYAPTRRVGLSPKLATHWRGPGEVLERMTDVVYRVRFPGRLQPVVLHRNRLFEYHPKLSGRGADAEPPIQPPVPPSPPRRARGRPRTRPDQDSAASPRHWPRPRQWGARRQEAQRRRRSQPAPGGGETSAATDTSPVPAPRPGGPGAGSDLPGASLPPVSPVQGGARQRRPPVRYSPGD